MHHCISSQARPGKIENISVAQHNLTRNVLINLLSYCSLRRLLRAEIF